MPIYEATDSVTGATIEMDGPEPPTQAEVEAAFLSLRPASGAGMAAAANANTYDPYDPKAVANYVELAEARAGGGKSYSLDKASAFGPQRRGDEIRSSVGFQPEPERFREEFSKSPVGQAFYDWKLGKIVKTGDTSFQQVGPTPEPELTPDELTKKLGGQIITGDIRGAAKTLKPGFIPAARLAGTVTSMVYPAARLAPIVVGALGEIFGQAVEASDAGQDPLNWKSYSLPAIAAGGIASRVGMGRTAPRLGQQLAQGALEGAAVEAPALLRSWHKGPVQDPTAILPGIPEYDMSPTDMLPSMALGALARGSHGVVNALGKGRRIAAGTAEGNQALTDAFNSEQRAQQGVDVTYQNNVANQAPVQAQGVLNRIEEHNQILTDAFNDEQRALQGIDTSYQGAVRLQAPEQAEGVLSRIEEQNVLNSQRPARILDNPTTPQSAQALRNQLLAEQERAAAAAQVEATNKAITQQVAGRDISAAAPSAEESAQALANPSYADQQAAQQYQRFANRDQQLAQQAAQEAEAAQLAQAQQAVDAQNAQQRAVAQRAAQANNANIEAQQVARAAEAQRVEQLAQAQREQRAVAVNQQRIDDFTAARAEEINQQVRAGQLGGIEETAIGNDKLRNQISAIETRRGLSASERARVEAQKQAVAPQEVPYLPPVEMSSQAMRMTDQYARTIPIALPPIAGAGVGAAIGSTQGDTPEERVSNSLKGLGIGALAGGAASFGMSRLAQPELNAGEQVLAKAAEAKRPVLANIVSEKAAQLGGNSAGVGAAANDLLGIPKLPSIAEATAQQSTLSTIKNKIVSGLKKAGKALTQGEEVPKIQGDYASTPDPVVGGPAPVNAYSPPVEGGSTNSGLFRLDQPVYNPDGSMAHPAGSHVSQASLEKLGFTVPEPSTLPQAKAKATSAPNIYENAAGTRDAGVSDGSGGTGTPYEQELVSGWKKQIAEEEKAAAALSRSEAAQGGARSPQFSGAVGSGGSSGAISKEMGVRLATGTLLGVGSSFFGETPDQQTLNAAAGVFIGLLAGRPISRAIEGASLGRAAATVSAVGKAIMRIDLPVMDAVAEKSAQKVVEFAGARESANAAAQDAKAVVAGSSWKNTEFKKRLNAFLLEDQLRGVRNKFEQQAKNATDLVKAQEAATKAEDVATIIGHKNGVFQTEADFQAALADPEIQAAAKRFHVEVGAPAEEHHLLASGYSSRQELEQKIQAALDWNKNNPGQRIPVPEDVLDVPGLNSKVFINIENILGDTPRIAGENITKDLSVGDIVRAPDRKNFGRVMDGGNGKVSVRFVNPETGATSVVDFPDASLKKTIKTQIAGEDKIDIYNARNASAGNLENPIMRRSAFSKQRLGTGENYSIDLDRTIDRMVKGNFSEAAKRRMFQQLEADGLGVMMEGGQAPTESGVFGGKIPVSKKSMSGTSTDQYFYPRKDIEEELRSALNTDGALSGMKINQTVKQIITTIQIKSLTDPVVHIANSLFTIAGSPGGETALRRAARKIPYVNLADAGIRMTSKAIKIASDSPAIRAEINKLGRAGGLRPEFGERHLMQTVDKAARLVLQDLYESRVIQYGLEDTPQARRKFAGQLGQYNPRLMNKFEAIMKAYDLSTFVVAGKNFNAVGLRRLGALAGLDKGAPGTVPKTLSDSIRMRAGQAVAGATTVAIAPFVANTMLWGDPFGPEGTPFGMIALTAPDENGKQITLDPAQTTLLRRGMRLTGVNALINGLMTGDNAGHIVGQAVKDIASSQIHPYAGPVPTLAVTALTGYTPSFHRVAENVTPIGQSPWTGRQLGENAKAALSNVNPMQGAFLDEANSKEPGDKTPSIIPASGVPIVDTLSRGAENAGADLIGAFGLRNRMSLNPDIGELHQAQDDRFDSNKNRDRLVQSIMQNSMGEDGKVDMDRVRAMIQTPEIQQAVHENPMEGKLLRNDIKTAVKENLQGQKKTDIAPKFTVAEGERAQFYLNHISGLSPEETNQYLADQKAKGYLTRQVYRQMSYLQSQQPVAAP